MQHRRGRARAHAEAAGGRSAIYETGSLGHCPHATATNGNDGECIRHSTGQHTAAADYLKITNAMPIGGDEYMNYKRFRRNYRLAGLQMGRRRRRGRAKVVRGRSLRRATRPFEGWTLDFIHDRLFNARSFRGLTIMDEFSRCGLALELNYSFPSKAVISVVASALYRSSICARTGPRGSASGVLKGNPTK